MPLIVLVPFVGAGLAGWSVNPLTGCPRFSIEIESVVLSWTLPALKLGRWLTCRIIGASVSSSVMLSCAIEPE